MEQIHICGAILELKTAMNPVEQLLIKAEKIQFMSKTLELHCTALNTPHVVINSSWTYETN